MISDTLEEAIYDIEYYLTDNHFGTYYQGQVRADIEKLVKEMKQVLKTLDAPPKVIK